MSDLSPVHHAAQPHPVRAPRGTANAASSRSVTRKSPSSPTRTPRPNAGKRGSGGIDSKLVGGYMPGDIDSWDVKAQRNTTASAAGSSYSIGTVAAGSGAEAMQKAIAADPVVIEIKAAIDAEKALGERASSERLATLRGELVARINSIADQAGKAAPQITVTGNTMVVVAPSNTGVTPPPISPEDAKAAAEIQGIIGAARSQSPPTSQPTKD